MDNLRKAQKMAKINLILDKLKQRETKSQNQSLEMMVLELIAAGNDRTQITQILAVREDLSPSEQRTLEMILNRAF